MAETSAASAQKRLVTGVAETSAANAQKRLAESKRSTAAEDFKINVRAWVQAEERAVTLSRELSAIRTQRDDLERRIIDELHSRGVGRGVLQLKNGSILMRDVSTPASLSFALLEKTLATCPDVGPTKSGAVCDFIRKNRGRSSKTVLELQAPVAEV